MLENRFRKPGFLDSAGKKEIMDRLKDYLSERKEVVFAYLYGSFMRDEAFRDIDVALFVKGNDRDFGLEADLSYDLTAVTGYPVEVRIINKAPVALQMATLRGRSLLFSRDEKRRTDFIQDVGKRYIEANDFIRGLTTSEED